MNNDKKAIDFIISAFYDYTDSRFLLINDRPLNGIILASLAIEKYLKSFLVKINGSHQQIHFDKISKLKKEFEGTGYVEIFKYVDPQFFNILSVGYKLRYFDNVKQKTTIGFVTKQVLAELDYFVNLLERLIIYDPNGDVLSPYKRAERNNDMRIFDNNYVLNKIDKKIFVEGESSSFSLIVDPFGTGPIEVIGAKIKFPYDGNMFRFIFQNKGEKPIVNDDIDKQIIEKIKTNNKTN